MKPLESLQATLAAEHAALYVLGVLGAQTSVSASPDLAGRLRTGFNLHRARRDQLVAMVSAAGGTPVAAEVAYEVPGPTGSARSVTAAARLVEERCCRTYADQVGSTWGANRQWALDAMTDAAVRQLGFRGSPEIFPGVAEL